MITLQEGNLNSFFEVFWDQWNFVNTSFEDLQVHGGGEGKVLGDIEFHSLEALGINDLVKSDVPDLWGYMMLYCLSSEALIRFDKGANIVERSSVHNCGSIYSKDRGTAVF